MAKKDPRIDAYIKKSAEFAQPILTHLRELVHQACPDIEETIKWGFPHFDYHGSMLCSMAAFKQHCSFGFWKASLLKDPRGILQVKEKGAMGNMDRITSLKDLPPDKTLIAFVKEAAMLNEMGVKLPPRKKSTISKTELETPEGLARAFQKNKTARTAFEAMSPSHRKEYIQWINEAKTEPTRETRIKTTVEWVTNGKSMHWKYDRKQK